MDDWQVGDKAVCVDGSPCRVLPFPGAPFSIPEGAVHEVTGVADRGDGHGLFLAFGSYPHSFHESRFRKVRPDAHEPCEAEFVTLLQRTKEKA